MEATNKIFRKRIKSDSLPSLFSEKNFSNVDSGLEKESTTSVINNSYHSIISHNKPKLLHDEITRQVRKINKLEITKPIHVIVDQMGSLFLKSPSVQEKSELYRLEKEQNRIIRQHHEIEEEVHENLNLKVMMLKNWDREHVEKGKHPEVEGFKREVDSKLQCLLKKYKDHIELIAAKYKHNLLSRTIDPKKTNYGKFMNANVIRKYNPYSPKHISFQKAVYVQCV